MVSRYIKCPLRELLLSASRRGVLRGSGADGERPPQAGVLESTQAVPTGFQEDFRGRDSVATVKTVQGGFSIRWHCCLSVAGGPEWILLNFQGVQATGTESSHVPVLSAQAVGKCKLGSPTPPKTTMPSKRI